MSRRLTPNPIRPLLHATRQGLERGYLHGFTLGAKQRWLFEQSAAVKDIVARAGPERMYVFTSLWGAWPTALVAGEIDLP